MQIRQAQPDDWASIWPFFQRIVTAEETYAYDPDIDKDSAERLWMQLEPPAHTVVAVDDTDPAKPIVGSATMYPNRPGPGSHIASASFMVDPDRHGKGIGRALGEYVIDWANRNGYRGIQFNAVVETNTAAVRLWQSLGFRIIGTVPGAFRSRKHGYVGLHVMFREAG
jgi:GNAT superfamily N-acetyltransferase